jgi:hypothetical protein
LASITGGRSGRVRDVGHEPDVIGAGGGEREQRPRVEEPMLVRMILPAD